MFRAMVGKHSGAVVQQVFRKMLVDLVRDEVQAMASPSDTASMPAETVVQFVGGGLYGVLMWWLDGRMRLSVEEVDTLFRRIAIAAVKAPLG